MACERVTRAHHLMIMVRSAAPPRSPVYLMRESPPETHGVAGCQIRVVEFRLHDSRPTLCRSQRDPGVFWRWEQDGNTRAVHERSRPVPADPVGSRMTWENDYAEQTDCTVVPAGAGLQTRERRAARWRVRFPSASGTSTDASLKGDRTSRA